MARDELISFEWFVPARGFAWVNGRATDEAGRTSRGRFLTPVRATDWPGAVRITQPFEDFPHLFGPFAKVPATEEGVLAFANRHGALALDSRMTRKRRGRRSAELIPAEPLDLWREEITTLRHAGNVLAAVQAGDTTPLKRWFPQRTKAGRLFDELTYEPDEPWPMGVAKPMVQYLDGLAANAYQLISMGGHVRGDPTGGDVPREPKERAVAWLRSVINVRLGSHTRVAMLDTPVTRGVAMVPKNLLGAIWLQFARAVEGPDRIRRCAACQEWFRLPTKAKAETMFCKTACRMRDLRARQVEAVRLSKRRVPVTTIATRVRSSPAMVKKWVRAARKRAGR